MADRPFVTREAASGLRASWSVLHPDNLERQKISIPNGVLLTPFKPLSENQTLLG